MPTFDISRYIGRNETMTPVQAIAEIKALVVPGGGGRADPVATKCYQTALASLRCQVSPSAFEHVTELGRLPGIYYSQRKHEKCPGGLPQIRVWILSTLDKLEAHKDRKG